jgi:AcrR family transcriptional regulator
VSSTSAIPPRRQPQQARATLRRAAFLSAAATLIGQHGYDAVTMTAIAEQARASIGTLYDYFPDKPAVAIALKMQYAEVIDAHWKNLLAPPLPPSIKALAHLFIEGMLTFVHQRPAYLPLLDAPIAYTRSAAARQPLRRTVAHALQALRPKLPPGRAYIHAQVIVQLLKSLIAVTQQAAPRDRTQVAEEFKKLMNLYLIQTLK